LIRAGFVGTILALLAGGVLGGVLAGGALAQEAPEDAPLLPLATQPGVLVAGGQELPMPVALTELGPLFAVATVVTALGGELVPDALGQSFTMILEGTSAVFGAGSAAMTVGEDIIMLSQPSRASDAGVLVPLDLLQHTYGELLGYELAWQPAALHLSAARAVGRELPLAVDVVHLQGITTVVLQFPQPPRFRVSQESGRVDVVFTGDRVRATAPPAVEDPLLRGIEVTPERVILRTLADVSADHYTLRRPFRLVFELYRATPATATPELRPQRPTPGIQTIVIDPGHGGSETGAIGPAGTAEKGLTLTIAQALKAALERRLGVRAVLTRGEDADLPLDTRAAIANQNKADLFMSIHLNSSLGASARGAETYFLAPQASDAAAASSAAVENQTAGGSGGIGPSADVGGDPLYDLQLMLWDLAQSHHLAASQRLAAMIQGELNQALDLRDRGVKQAPFRVLMGAAMPAVLVELGFISNADEESKLNTPTYRSDLVDALVRAVERYRAELSGVAAPAVATAEPTAEADAAGAAVATSPPPPGRP
jgi:N-acetylmuramoyl-L-alanine amidase